MEQNSLVTMIKGKLNRNIVVLIGVFVLLIVGVISLVSNRGFYFWEYNVNYTVQFPDSIEVEKLDEFSRNKGVAKVDRETLSVRYQEITQEEFNSISEGLREEFGEENISTSVEQLLLPYSIVNKILTSTAVLLGATLLVFYFLVLRKLGKQSMFNTWRAELTYALATILGVLTHLGLISLLSTIYEIKLITLIGIVLNFLLAEVIVFGMLYESLIQRPGEIKLYKNLLNSNRKWLQNNYRNIFAILAFATIWLVLGLGPLFIIDALVFFVGIVIMITYLRFVPDLARTSSFKKVKKVVTKSETNNDVVELEVRNPNPKFVKNQKKVVKTKKPKVTSEKKKKAKKGKRRNRR